jgi:tetratricopeptide (TPR) repeat protein
VTPQEVFDLRLQATPLLFSTADMERFGERVAEIVTRAERLGDRARLSRAYTHSCEYLRSQHEYTKALEAGEKALGLAIGVGNADLKTRATFQLGCVYAWRGEEQRALEYFEAATAEPLMLTEGDATGTSNGFPYLPALARRVMALAGLGRFADALPLAAHATALVEAGVQPAAFALAYVGGMCLAQGRIEEAIAQFLRSLDVQRERGFQIAHAFCTSSLAEAYALCGQRAEASAVLEETADWYRSMPGPAHRSLVLTRLASALLLVDRMDDARRHGLRALDFARQYGEPGSEANARYLLGQVMLHDAMSSSEPAETEFREALTIATRLGMRPLAAHCRCGLARVSQRRDKHDDARDHIIAATTMYRDMEMVFWLGRAERLLSELGGS